MRREPTRDIRSLPDGWTLFRDYETCDYELTLYGVPIARGGMTTSGLIGQPSTLLCSADFKELVKDVIRQKIRADLDAARAEVERRERERTAAADAALKKYLSKEQQKP